LINQTENFARFDLERDNVDRLDRSPARRMFMLVIENQTNRAMLS
jgi:hypothetical protein